MNIKFWTKLTPGTFYCASEIEIRDYNNRNLLVGWLIAYKAEGITEYLREINFYKGWRVSFDMIEGEAKLYIKDTDFLGIVPF